MTVTATVISDASLCHDTKAGGWAAYVAVDGGIRVQNSGAFKRRPKDVNEAELWAVINGLTIAKLSGAKVALVQTDSLHVVRLIQQNKHAFSGHLRRLGLDIRVKARHVKGHTKRKEPRFWCNRWCDKEARRHMKLQRKELTP